MKPMTTTVLAAMGFAVALGVTACEKKEPAPAPATKTASTQTTSLPASVLLTAEPADAKPVEAIKGTVKVGDTVAVRGRVGGSGDPFVAGRAVFTLVGPGLNACSENPGDKCTTPWDYCCEPADEIAKHSATVQIVDTAGAPIKADVKGQYGIKELSDLIVVGKVVEADDKLLVVNATGIYVAKP